MKVKMEFMLALFVALMSAAQLYIIYEVVHLRRDIGTVQDQLPPPKPVASGPPPRGFVVPPPPW